LTLMDQGLSPHPLHAALCALWGGLVFSQEPKKKKHPN
jgi:hypothetical protein